VIEVVTDVTDNSEWLALDWNNVLYYQEHVRLVISTNAQFRFTVEKVYTVWTNTDLHKHFFCVHNEI